ncbi:NAD(P)-dependent dehydrogenase (short-subunit alcohol dehydrogenase family) [Streptomyces sp. B3I7]|nr:hypothetical protein [Streptomyces sp. B3I7]MDQ0809264.1 NAD(P)-dependent dehydrogenase (short-subunit alcohol dehydrogenase family) [Streptomyces sp. B3I7]
MTGSPAASGRLTGVLVAEAVALLSSPASSYVDGAILTADGGERSLLPG